MVPVFLSVAWDTLENRTYIQWFSSAVSCMFYVTSVVSLTVARRQSTTGNACLVWKNYNGVAT